MNTLTALTKAALAAMDRNDWSTALGLWLCVVSDWRPAVQSYAWGNAALCYEALGHGDARIAAGRHAACLNVENAENMGNLGAWATAARNTDEAEAYFMKSLSTNPELPHSLNGMSAVCAQRGDHVGALQWAEACLRRAPDTVPAHWNVSLACLAQGQWERGWHEHAWRVKLPGVGRALPKPTTKRWEGEELKGTTLLVLGEQGFGDCLQWSRHLQRLHRMGVRVVVETYEPIVPLLKKQDYIAEAVPRGVAFPAHDHWCFLLDLCGGLKWTPETDDVIHPVFKVHPLPRLTGRTRIGFAWRGRQEHANNINRSMSDEEAAEFVEAVPDVEWVQISPDNTLPLIHGYPIRNFHDSARIIASCDAVISIDSAPLHLAGSLAVPTLGLMHHVPEWRWLHYGWYPGFQMVAQPKHKDWTALIPAVHQFVTQRMERAA